jgi:AhpD family alkylhydroperoxidase
MMPGFHVRVNREARCGAGRPRTVINNAVGALTPPRPEPPPRNATLRLSSAMATTRPLADPESNPRVKAVFDDIRATRKSAFINNLWHHLAFDPALLERTWAEVKAVMATPASESALDPLTKEMIYIAVSVANACSYCVHSHTAAAKAKGMTPEQHGELLAIVALAGKTNHLVTALQVPLDEAFDAMKR